jgi:hypothetical protein
MLTSVTYWLEVNDQLINGRTPVQLVARVVWRRAGE